MSTESPGWLVCKVDFFSFCLAINDTTHISIDNLQTLISHQFTFVVVYSTPNSIKTIITKNIEERTNQMMTFLASGENFLMRTLRSSSSPFGFSLKCSVPYSSKCTILSFGFCFSLFILPFATLQIEYCVFKNHANNLFKNKKCAGVTPAH